MTEPDIFRKNGIEYDIVSYETHHDLRWDGNISTRSIFTCRPKRVPTGRICTGRGALPYRCTFGPCIVFRGTCEGLRKDRKDIVCAVRGTADRATDWRPYYGEVIDDDR